MAMNFFTKTTDWLGNGDVSCKTCTTKNILRDNKECETFPIKDFLSCFWRGVRFFLALSLLFIPIEKCHNFVAEK